MAFNFNWTPLASSGGADSSSAAFYSHAKSLLTAALNKSAKPPIIVDDIFVDDLNLGHTAPDLEILEIGDLAEDRFRGIFRMSYGGDAELTLKTRVQANPLNTYLSTTPAFTSPDPLAASSPLTIPLQITLSQFRLSGFVILVFSKDKGITLVFRNDPLESLKVSSTFDSIPFIKEYLQKEIERQVRGLFQEELPVAVHRLSLRLWNPEYAASLGLDSTPPAKPDFREEDTTDVDPEDTFFNPLLPADSADGSSDSPSPTFSQKNMLHLAALMDSQRTLSVFTPSIRDAVFRAWASSSGSNASGRDRAATPAGASSPEIRPSLLSTASAMSLPTSPGRTHTPASRRKRKHRVVNLRSAGSSSKASTTSDVSSDADGETTTSESSSVPPRNPPFSHFHPRPHPHTHQHHQFQDSIDETPAGTLRTNPSAADKPPMVPVTLFRPTSPIENESTENITFPPTSSHSRSASAKEKEAMATKRKETTREKEKEVPAEKSARPSLNAGPRYSSGILEKAFMMKLAGEMQRRLEEERGRRGERERWAIERELDGLAEPPPPAYNV